MKTTMKKVLSMALALVLVIGMLPMAAQATGECGHTNKSADWVRSTNYHWKTCANPDCADVKVDQGAHDWIDATCLAPQTCSVCSATQGEPLGHLPGPAATCNTPQICARPSCGVTIQNALGTGSATGHDMRQTTAAVAPSCTVAGQTAILTCANGCGKTEGGTYVAATGNHIDANNAWEHNDTQHFYTCTCGAIFDTANHVWEAATATTPEVCTICRRTRDGALGTSTFNVYVVMGGVTQNGGSFTMTAGSTKTANDILNAFLATSTYSASTISSYYVTANGSQLTGNQTLALAAASTYTLTITPANNVNNNYTNNNPTVISVGFVPNYNTYNYATSVASPVPAGTRVYDIAHNVTRTGYTLEGWYYDAATTQRVPADATVTGSTTFYAKWTQIAPYNVSVVIYTNGNKNTPTVTLDLYSWAQDGEITLADLQQAVTQHGIKANNNAGLSVYGPFTPNQWTSYVSHDYFRNSTERVSVNSGEATVLYAMVHNVKITKGTVDPYGAIADKTNPKTGDMIYAPMMVLGLSASALAVLFYLNKKRAF